MAKYKDLPYAPGHPKQPNLTEKFSLGDVRYDDRNAMSAGGKHGVGYKTPIGKEKSSSKSNCVPHGIKQIQIET
jgi:hypothetical protein